MAIAMDQSQFSTTMKKYKQLENIGDVVHSILVHENKLFVIVNNSHLIKRYSITETGLSLPGNRNRYGQLKSS